MNEIGKTFLNVVDAVIGRPPIDTNIALGSVILKLDAKELKPLRELQDTADEATRTMSEFSEDQGRQAFYRQQAEHSDHAKTKGKLASVRTRSYQSLLGEYAAKVAAARMARDAACASAIPIALPLLKRFVESAEKYIADRKRQEAEEAASFGLSPVASAPTVAAQNLAALCKNRLAVGLTGQPKQMLPFALLD